MNKQKLDLKVREDIAYYVANWAETFADEDEDTAPKIAALASRIREDRASARDYKEARFHLNQVLDGLEDSGDEEDEEDARKVSALLDVLQ